VEEKNDLKFEIGHVKWKSKSEHRGHRRPAGANFGPEVTEENLARRSGEALDASARGA
jgi:hypothetical protein